ncbi:MAG: tetratricopeptide repeat protein [candidate division Zixibacteria bacterium]|nr:tetratricopeptide repeat protein [candidate division Zixibacteria bacterium]
MLKVWMIILLWPAILAAADPASKGAKMETTPQSAADLLELADSSFQQREIAKSFEQYKLAAEAARAEFNRPIEVEALAQMARTFLTQGKGDEGKPYLAEAASKADDSDALGWSRFLGVKGRFEWKANDLATARRTFEEYYNYCALHNLQSRAIDAANMNGIVAETPEQAIEWTKRGIEIAESCEAEGQLGPLWNNLGGIHYDLKQYDQALECYLKARDFHWRFSGETAKLFADYHVGMAYRLTGQTEKAKQWLRPVLSWAERIGNHSAMAQACDDLGEIEREAGNKAEALKLLTQAREHFKADAYPEHSPAIWRSITERVERLEAELK